MIDKEKNQSRSQANPCLAAAFTMSVTNYYSFSIFLFTNSLKSLPFNKFFESKARS